MRCDKRVDCTDSSDEIGCECEGDEFTCDCVTDGTCSSVDGCLKINELKNGFVRCPDRRILWGSFGRVNIYRLYNISECNDIGFPQCDNSTCYYSNFSTCVDRECFESHVICTSKCDDDELCKGVLQCNDNNLIFYSQFCDGIIDCFDRSDETIRKPGFKCKKCILPQSNLYDDFAHCRDNSDFCFSHSDACVQCLDQRLLISARQVCNGEIDCYGLSDECLCEEYFDSEMCMHKFKGNIFQCFDNELTDKSMNLFYNFQFFTTASDNFFHHCNTKFNSLILATTCDLRPECKDYSDECDCPSPPRFCSDPCRLYFPMGDRYCDGVEDPAWQYISEPECSRGFDELLCPKRFKCNASGKVSIDVQQVCDGKADCDDGSDENDCRVVSRIQSIFSSETEMIANSAVKAAFWIMGFVIIIGNAYVVVTSIALLRKKHSLDIISFHQVIILNISIADFIMGIYLLAVASYDASFSGMYGFVDSEWRSSLRCSIIGSLAVFSSETSCFLMVILTAFRLRNVTKALESMAFSLRPWKIMIVCVWFVSLTISIIPTLSITSQYFLHSFSYFSAFGNGILSAASLEQFVCRYAALNNTVIVFSGNEFQSIKAFIDNNLSDVISIKLFGYYGETSVCMPRFYVAYGESSWEYTLAIITLNFLSFLFIAVCYFVLYKHFSASSANPQNNRTNEEASTMQKRIARIIGTDFCCWIPICILAYVRLGVEFSDIIYQISAVLLLPINSAMNPFLFSSLPDRLMNFCRRKYESLKQMRLSSNS